MNYDTSSRAYLKRAKSNFDSGNIDSLFYAAFELRCGVEARLKEYVLKPQNCVSLRKLPWEIAKLAKILAKSSKIHDKRCVFVFIRPKTKQRHDAVYYPVTKKLRNVAQKLGDFLHCLDQNRASESTFLERFRQLVKSGIEELTLATSGCLTAPPLANSRRISFKFEKEQNAKPV